MKNATRRIPIASAATLAISPTVWAVLATCTSGEVASAFTAAAIGAAFGATACALGWHLARRDPVVRSTDEADRPDPEARSWASPQGLPTAGPGEPVRRRDGHGPIPDPKRNA